MPLIATTLAASLKQFILQMNSKEQPNVDVAIQSFCDKLEEVIYEAIKSQTIIIPSGIVTVAGANSGGPLVATNVNPIILTGVVT